MREGAEAFLAAHGFGAAAREALPSDASFRRYVRLLGGPRPALLMDAPPPQEDVRPFLHVGGHLARIGLAAPEVIAADAERGFLLLEDLGRETMAMRLDAGADPLPLYRDAVAALAALHEAPPPEGLPAWGAPRMAETAAATFLDWWWPEALGAKPDDAVRAEFHAAIHAMLAPFAARGFVHRDFFPANLMPLAPAAERHMSIAAERHIGIAAERHMSIAAERHIGSAAERHMGIAAERHMGIIDFQDAAYGHPAYDLVSLVEDARRDVAEDVRQAAIACYLARRPMLDAGAFRAAMAVHAAQRHLRVAALWTRLARRDGKWHYLKHGPRCWALLDRALDHPATAPLRRFLDAHVPRDLRANPASLQEHPA